MGRETHALELHVNVTTPEEWDRIHAKFTVLARELKGFPTVRISSYDLSAEPDVEDKTEFFDDMTIPKVYNAIKETFCVLRDLGYDFKDPDLYIRSIVNDMQNAGILFRERRP